MHPAVGGGGEVTHLCPDLFHGLSDGDTEQTALFDPPSGDEANEQNAVTQEGSDHSSSSHCCFCGRRVSREDPTTHEEVTSWVRGKKKDSAVLRTRSGRLGCGDCIAKMRAGVALDQQDYETLLEEPPQPSEPVDGIFSDRSHSYNLGYAYGLAERPPPPDGALERHDLNRADWHEGYIDGEEMRLAKQRFSTPLAERER